MPPIFGSSGDGSKQSQVSALPEWRVKKQRWTALMGYLFGALRSSDFFYNTMRKEKWPMLEIRVVSPVAKVLPDEAPEVCTPKFAGMKNEVISFQLAFRNNSAMPADRRTLQMEIDSPAKDAIRVRRVKYVPVRLAAFDNADENYLRGGAAGMYPDPLMDIPAHGIRSFSKTWESLWIDVKPEGKLAAGDYPITLRLTEEGTDLPAGEVTVQLHVIDAELPKQKLIHTKWFHCDCLADYYEVEIFSEKHWEIIENYIRCAVEHGINTILTPTHTPPLDTRIGTYRPTVQLVDVTFIDGKYTFGFEKLRRWVDMCKRCGVEWYEISHLFSQWGARTAPQVVAATEEGVKRIFGWDTPATGEAYTAFLNAYLPALLDELEALGIADRCLFHISDEPNKDHLDGYLAAKALVKKHLRGQKLIDALSDVALCDSGAVEHPVPANNHMEPFLERNIPDLWTYYCCGQGVDVSNLFLSMPGARTRVLGAQLYKYNIKGFLHWGFNFYYAQYSDYLINPWLDTDCDGFAQAGDGYQVYPDRGGKPAASLRLMLVQQALQDLRAMQLLESLTDRATVAALIDEGVEPITFSKYPHDDGYVLGLREKINAEIEKRI